ncbi:uncharacterized protein LOC131928143 [Physella acuta]|uniref:uncharacterized protein LOC131928143 n=1 Tax=Physella acuta TaxID=109671 RepID=UPI0027DCC809|nr:uncharacterized protein LOC131928143 [Physella acuta]
MTEYCGRGDLFSMLRQLDSALIMTRHYMLDVVNGLECLHNKYIAHSDIKMKNILITDNNIAKIADFGFAKRYSSDEDVEKISRGTRDYWAPEMRVVRPCFNPFKTDIYALGVTFVGACIKRPVKRKCDDIKDIVRKFEDPGQASLFHGLLRSDPKKRLDFHMIKANFWLTEHLSTSPD